MVDGSGVRRRQRLQAGSAAAVAVKVYLGQGLLARVDDLAERQAVSRSTMVAELLAEAVAADRAAGVRAGLSPSQRRQLGEVVAEHGGDELGALVSLLGEGLQARADRVLFEDLMETHAVDVGSFRFLRYGDAPRP